MALPQPAMMLPKEILHGTVALRTKPTASLHYSWVFRSNNSEKPSPLVVFLNGLMADKSAWLPVMAGIIRKQHTSGISSMLAYDRYGQGMTENRDPLDCGREKGYGHDVADVVQDLRLLLVQFAQDRLDEKLEDLCIVLVANSIGCAIARLYAQKYPGTVSALLLLDSMMANSDFDWWPDPDAGDFDPEQLPPDVTIEVLREQRTRFAEIFKPDVINKEGLDRRNIAALLPKSDAPALIGPGDQGPLLTVVGHDPWKFAEESLKSMSTPISLTMKYSNPLWHSYNEDLAKITELKQSRGPIIAKGCGHFVQRDDPSFVVEELLRILDRLKI